jgi:hypothetical protein
MMRKSMDITSHVQSGFPFKRKIDEKSGLDGRKKSPALFLKPGF